MCRPAVSEGLTAWIRSALALAAWLSTACGSGQPAAMPALDQVPEPVLDRLEEVTRQRILDGRSRLEAALGSSDSGAAGRRRLERLFGDLGGLYLAHELRPAAAVCFDNAMRLDPSAPGWPYLLGATLQLEGRFDQAARHLDRAAALRPRDLPTLLRLGRVELDRGRQAAAEAHYRRALEIDPDAAAAHYGLGLIAGLRGDPEAVIVHLSTAVELQPDAGAAHHQLGLAYRDRGDSRRAQTHLGRSGSRTPDFHDPLIDQFAELRSGARIHLAQGVRAQRTGDRRRALDHFRRAVDLEPHSAKAHHSLGAALGMSGDHQAARRHLERAVELDGDLANAHFDLAAALAQSGELEAALAALSRALELDPDDRTVRLKRAQVLSAIGRTGEAVAELEVLAADVDSAEIQLQLAALQLRRGRPTDASASYDAAAMLDPRRGEAHLGAARARLVAGSHRQARQRLEEGLEELPNDPSLRLALAQLLATSSDPAVGDGARALELATALFEEQHSLEHGETVAMALAAAGRPDEAAAWQRQLIDQAEAAGVEPDLLDRLRRSLAGYQTAEQGNPGD